MKRIASLAAAGTAILALLLSASAPPARGSEVLQNGGFADGLAHWQVETRWGASVDTEGQQASFYATGDLATPITGTPTPGAPGSPGSAFYAVSDASTMPVATVLYQTFTMPGNAAAATLTFSFFVQDTTNYAWTHSSANPGGLRPNSGNHFATIDLLTGTAKPFSTASGDVLANLYTSDGLSLPETAGGYSYYVSPGLIGLLAPGECYTLRFATVNTLGIINLGASDVSLTTTAVPEPSSMVVLAELCAFAACIAATRRRREKRSATRADPGPRR